MKKVFCMDYLPHMVEKIEELERKLELAIEVISFQLHELNQDEKFKEAVRDCLRELKETGE
jgi:hypothetical protein